MIPAVRKGKDKVERISALQLEKGLKKRKVSPHSWHPESTRNGKDEHIPEGITRVLQEYSDIMPPELPKTLPPRRTVDHRIELEVGAKPPARAPYRMASPVVGSSESN